MKKILILADNTRIDIGDTPDISNVVVSLNTDNISTLFNNLTEEKLKKVDVAIVDTVGGSSQEDIIQNYTNVIVIDSKIIFTENHGIWNATFGLREKTNSEKKIVDMSEAVMFLSDTDAVAYQNLYPSWSEMIGKTVKKGTKFNYKDGLFKTIQDNLLIQSHYIPGQGTEALYVRINETHAGTEKDPIPWVSNMQPEVGKYYVEGDLLCKCIEDPLQPLYHSLKDLCTGRYFTQVVFEQGSTTPEFKQPTGAHDAYKKGAQVMYKGKKYESLIDNNVYAPDAYPQGWKELVK